MFRIPNVPWANWNSYLEGGGLQGEEIVKSTLFCKVHYVLNSDIKIYIRYTCLANYGASEAVNLCSRYVEKSTKYSEQKCASSFRE
jgi:hypothetical protein